MEKSTHHQNHVAHIGSFIRQIHRGLTSRYFHSSAVSVATHSSLAISLVMSVS